MKWETSRGWNVGDGGGVGAVDTGDDRGWVRSRVG
jgi:hypothetical protein